MEKLTLKVPEMSCGHCVSAVAFTVGRAPGVSGVQVDLDGKWVEVTGKGLEATAIEAAVRDAGYKPEGA